MLCCGKRKLSFLLFVDEKNSLGVTFFSLGALFFLAWGSLFFSLGAKQFSLGVTFLNSLGVDVSLGVITVSLGVVLYSLGVHIVVLWITDGLGVADVCSRCCEVMRMISMGDNRHACWKS